MNVLIPVLILILLLGSLIFSWLGIWTLTARDPSNRSKIIPTLFIAASIVLGHFIHRHVAKRFETVNKIRQEILAIEMDEPTRSYYLGKLDKEEGLFNFTPGITTDEAKTILEEAKKRFPKK
jgi:hypothetical protein